MNKKRQRIVLAELHGWVYHEPTSETGDIALWSKGSLTAWCIHDLPNYLHDLNEIDELIAVTLLPSQIQGYIEHLFNLTNFSFFPKSPSTMTFIEAFVLTLASAEDKAEAFLKAIDRWDYTNE